MDIKLQLSARHAAALVAACVANNAADRVDLTPEEFAQAFFDVQMDGFAAALNVGLIAPYEFVERFQRLGVYDRIFGLSKTDDRVAGYLAILRAKRDDVNLFSDTVLQGLAYLQQLGELTAAQADWIRSLDVPAPAETMPTVEATP